MSPTYNATMETLFTGIMLLLYVSLGYAIPAVLTWIKAHRTMPDKQRRAASAAVLTGTLLLFVPAIAFASPWYEREPFVGPVSYVLGAVAMAGAAWLTGLFAKGKKLDIENANRKLAESLENQLQQLMLQAIAAIEERAAAHPKAFDSNLKRSEALVLFRKSLPAGIKVPHDKAEVLLDSMLALHPTFGASGKKVA